MEIKNSEVDTYIRFLVSTKSHVLQKQSLSLVSIKLYVNVRNLPGTNYLFLCTNIVFKTKFDIKLYELKFTLWYIKYNIQIFVIRSFTSIRNGLTVSWIPVFSHFLGDLVSIWSPHCCPFKIILLILVSDSTGHGITFIGKSPTVSLSQRFHRVHLYLYIYYLLILLLRIWTSPSVLIWYDPYYVSPL